MWSITSYVSLAGILALVGALLSAIGVYLKKDSVVLCGAVLAFAGGVWAMVNQVNYETQLREKTDKIFELQTDVYDHVTGGESYVYVWVAFDEKRPLDVYFLPSHKGDHPVFDVKVQITDDDKLAHLALQGGAAAPVRLLTKATQIHTLGTFPPGSVGSVIGPIMTGERTSRKFRVLVSARNGMVQQKLRLKRVGDHWARATKGKVSIFIRGRPTREFEEADPDFPRLESGEIEW